MKLYERYRYIELHRRVKLPGMLFLSWVLVHSASVFALEHSTFLQIHGFLTQAYTLTSDNNFYGASSSGNGSFDASEIGLNASWRPNGETLLSAQILSRRAGEISDGDPMLDYGFVDYRVISNEKNIVGFRVGKTKNPFGIYNDTRDVAFTRPSIILPQSIYFDRTRDLALASDAIHVYGDSRTKKDEWHWQLGVALPDVENLDTEIVMLGADRPGKLEDEPSIVSRIIYERSGGKSLFAISNAWVNFSYDPAANDPSEAGDIVFAPIILTVQHTEENWSITSEYARRKFKFDDSILYVPEPLQTLVGESAYLQGTYRFSADWEAVLRYDVTYLNKHDRSGKAIEQLTDGSVPAYSQFAKDWTIGLLWNPNRSWMFRIEQHWVDGTAWLPHQDNPDRSETVRRWKMFAVLASYRF